MSGNELKEAIKLLRENQDILGRDWLIEYGALARCQYNDIRGSALGTLADLCRNSWPQNADLGYGLAAFIRSLPYEFIRENQALWIELLSGFAETVKQKEAELGHSVVLQEHVQVFHVVCLTLARAMVVSGVTTFNEALKGRLYASFESISSALSGKDALRQGRLLKQRQDNENNKQYPYALAYRLKYTNQFIVRVASDQVWWVDLAKRFWHVARVTDAVAGVVRNQGQGVTDALGGVLQNLKGALWAKDEKGVWHRALECLEMELTHRHLERNLDGRHFERIVKSFEQKVQVQKNNFTQYFKADWPLLVYGYAQQLQRFALWSEVPEIQRTAVERLSSLFLRGGRWGEHWHARAMVVNTLLCVYHAPSTSSRTKRYIMNGFKTAVSRHNDETPRNKMRYHLLLEYNLCTRANSQLADPLPQPRGQKYPDILLSSTLVRGALWERLVVDLQRQAEFPMARGEHQELRQDHQHLGDKIDALAASSQPPTFPTIGAGDDAVLENQAKAAVSDNVAAYPANIGIFGKTRLNNAELQVKDNVAGVNSKTATEIEKSKAKRTQEKEDRRFQKEASARLAALRGGEKPDIQQELGDLDGLAKLCGGPG